MDLDSKSAAEKVVTNWVVGPTEDVLQALMEKLVYPRLPWSSRSSASTHPPSQDEQKAVARQMHAVVLLYNYYHRKQKPELRFLELESFCNLAVVLKPSLAAFMEVTKECSSSMESNGAEYDQLSLTEKAIKDACGIAAALDASVEVPNTEGWPIFKVAVLLIDSNKENCRLQFGAFTEGVWSLFEKELVDKSRINPEKSAETKVGDKRKRNTLKALTYNEILQICYNVVKEITGTESNELVVLGSQVTYSLSKEKSATQFYLIQLPGSETISLKEQVPLKFLVENLEGPLAEKVFGSWSATEVVSYYHMLPYVGFISHWFSGKDLCSPSIHGGFAQSTVKGLEEHNTDSDSSGKTTTNSSVAVNKIQTSTDHVVKNANQRRDSAKKNTSSRNYLEKLIKHMNECENGKKLVKDDVVLKKSIKARATPVSAIKEAVNADQHKITQSKGCSPNNLAADISETQKLCKESDTITSSATKNEEGRIDAPNILLLDNGAIEDCGKEGSLFSPSPNNKGLQSVIDSCETSPQKNSGEGTTKSEKLKSSSIQIDDNHDDTAFNVELEDTLKKSYNNTECTDGKKVTGESVGVLAISFADQIQAAITKPTLLPENELASSSSEELQNALALLCTKREQIFSRICSMEDMLAQYEDCIERIRDGGEVGLARRCVESIISGNKHWMLKNETRMQDKDHNSKSQTEKQSSRLSGIFIPGKSKCQDLEYMCLKNNWILPRYFVEPSEGKFVSNVMAVSKDFKLALKGGLESSPRKARESAAAQMIAKIYYEAEELVKADH